MTQTAKEKDFNFDYLLHPAGAFRTPMEVVNDLDMTGEARDPRVLGVRCLCRRGGAGATETTRQQAGGEGG